MSDNSKIQWTEASWNPVTGCSVVSPGCEHCYAATLSQRFGYTKQPWTAQHAAENVQLHPERLDQPLHWRRPRRIFVNSMSDLFHDQVPDGFLIEVFAHMWWAPQHTFQVLTKRPARMGDPVLMSLIETELRERERSLTAVDCPTPLLWPLPNVWLGVSVEDQRSADERIPILLQTPGAVRFVSAEPLLEDIYIPVLDMGRLDWIIIGGESGPNCRRLDLEWVRSLVWRARHSGPKKPAVFIKQLGGYAVSATKADHLGRIAAGAPMGSEPTSPEPWRLWLHDRKGGNPEEWPKDLRVREWPECSCIRSA